MKLFLSHAGVSEVNGGVEVYGSHLANVFPDLQVVDYHSLASELGDTIFPLLREPERARLLGKYISKNYPAADVLITNGMFCHNLQHPRQFNVCHGSYSAFAKNALSPISPDYYRLRFIYSHFEKKAARNAKAVISNSLQTQENVRTLFGLGSQVIYPPVDLDLFAPTQKEKAKRAVGWAGINALFVGRPERAKGFDFVEFLAKSNPSVNFRCILSRPYATNLANLEVIGAIAHSSLPIYYSAADLIVFPSRFEGFGLVVPEALACGGKVLCLNTGIASELEDNANLYIAKPTEREVAASFGDAMAARAEKLPSKALCNFSVQEFSKRWNAVLES